MKKAPLNTETDKAGKTLMLIEALAGGSEGQIERQEAQGQQSFVTSDTLPADVGDDGQRILEAAGAKFCGPVPDDKIFQYVELPPGWTKQPTDHSMWSDLVDDRGRVRAGIFYKAAFYDRSAFCQMRGRFSVRGDYDRRERDGTFASNVYDGQTVIYTTEPVTTGESYGRMNSANKAAEAWLDTEHPDWRDAGAYWD